MSTPIQSDDTLIEGLARVVGIDGDQVWLATEPPAACGSCGTRSTCGNGSAKRAPSWRVPRSLGAGQALLALGDTVQVGVDRSALTRASITAYTLPLVSMLIAASMAQGAGDGLAILAALAGLMLGVVAARRLTRRWRDALVPVVLGRSIAAMDSHCTPTQNAQQRRIAIPVIHHRSL